MASDLGMKLGVEGEKEFRDAIKNIGEQFKTLESEMKLVESQFGKNDSSASALTAKNQVLTKEIEVQTDKINAIKDALAASSEKYGDNDTRTQSWQRALNIAQADLNNLNTRLGENESALQSAGNASGEAANKVGEVGTQANSSGGLLDTLKNTAGNLATTMGSTLKDAVGNVASALGDTLKNAASLAMDALKNVGSVALDFAKSSIEVGQNFDASMSQVAAVSGASGEDFDALRDKAQEMGAKTKFSASEAADAMNYMAMAGWKTNDMIGGIEGIMNLAAASGEDLATTSDIVTDALTAFGLGASDSGHFADILAAASSNANTNVSMMGETFKYAAPVMGSMGYSAEDAALAIGMMANAGVKASSAGTALRAGITSLAKPAKQAATYMDKYGISLTDSEGNMLSFRDLIGELREKLGGLGEQEQAAAAAAIFGKNAMSGWLALINGSDTDLSKLQGAIDGCTQTVYAITPALEQSGIDWEKYADKAWMAGDGFRSGMDIMADEVIYNLDTIGTSAEDLQDYLHFEYDLDMEDAEKVVEIAKKNLENVHQAVQNTTVDWGKYKDVVFSTGKGVEGLTSEIISAFGDGMVAEEIPEMLEKFYGIDYSDAVAAVEAVNQAMNTTTGAAQEMANVMQDNLAGDITIFQSAMEGAQIALSDQLTPSLREFVQFGTNAVSSLTQAFQEGGLEGLFSELGTVIADAGTMIADMLPGMVSAGGQMLTSLMQGITDNLPQLQETLSGLITSFMTFLTEQLPQIITSGCELLTGLLTGISQTIPEIAPQLGEVITTIVTTLIDCLPQLLEAGGQLLMSLAEGIISLLPDLIEMLPDIITAIVDFVSENLPTILQAGADILTQLVEGIASTIPTLTEKMPEVLAAFTDYIQNALPDILQTGVDILTNVMNGITETIPTLVAALPEVLDGFVKFFVDNGTSILNTGIDVLTQLINGIIDTIPTLIEALPGVISAIVDTITENFPTIVQNGIDLLVKFASGILDAIPKLVEQVPKILEAIIKTITENLPKIIQCGVTLVESLFKQLPSAISTLASKVPQIITAIVNALKNGLSQITQVGKNLITGLWNGINDAKQWILDKIKGFGDSVLSAIKGFFGIKSPSKEMAWVGEMLGAGLGVGIEKSTKGAVLDACGMAKDVSSALNTISLPELGTLQARVAATTSFGSSQSPADALAAALDPGILASAISKSLSGAGVYLSGRKVGNLVTQQQSNAVKARAGAIIPV